MQPSRFSRRGFFARANLAALGVLSTHKLFADDPPLPTVDEWIREQAAEAPLAMQFQGSTAAECRQWQADFGNRLRSLLGPFALPGKWRTLVKSTANFQDHRRDELILTAAGLPPLPVYLLTPSGQ